MEQDPHLIIDPRTGDTARAEDILDELHAVLKKYGYVLAHKPHAMLLAKVDGVGGHQARVIAEVKQITPDLIEWRRIDWTPKVETAQ